MSTTSTTAGEVIDMAAALLNDTAQSRYTPAVQLPYINIACAELQEECQVNNIPSTQETSAVVTVAADVDRIVPVTDPDASLPKYPSDLIEIQQLWERNTGTSQEYQPIQKYDYIPHWWETDPATNNLEVWAWLSQEIRFGTNGATVENDVKIDYIKTLFPQAITENTVIGIIGSLTFLGYRTAGLIANYSGENPTRAQQLMDEADKAMWRLLGIGTKGRQSIPVRRRPFMQAYKNRMSDW